MSLMIWTGKKKGIIYDVSSASIETKDKIARIYGRKLPLLTLEIVSTFIYCEIWGSFDWYLSPYKNIYGITSSDYFIMTYNDRECLGEIK